MKGYIIMFFIIAALLARSCSAAKPSAHRCNVCKGVCLKNYMTCMKGCRRHQAARADVCIRKKEKCDAKCEKTFGRG
ncbi:hypothetical protein LSAT2_005989 [Lamellibrachia satsuma]|nr:hypothetical protein LSAT2_005989 [Lamellibrachia satsuma]